jgi:hypothetical protein
MSIGYADVAHWVFAASQLVARAASWHFHSKLGGAVRLLA